MSMLGCYTGSHGKYGWNLVMLVMITVLKVATEHSAATKVCADERSSTFFIAY